MKLLPLIMLDYRCVGLLLACVWPNTQIVNKHEHSSARGLDRVVSWCTIWRFLHDWDIWEIANCRNTPKIAKCRDTWFHVRKFAGFCTPWNSSSTILGMGLSSLQSCRFNAWVECQGLLEETNPGDNFPSDKRETASMPWPVKNTHTGFSLPVVGISKNWT